MKNKRKIIIFTLFIFISFFIYSQDYLISDSDTINTCGGVFYDSGGNSGDYGRYEDQTITICSDDGSEIRFVFTEFKTKVGDNLIIYNENDTVGVYSGNSITETIISSGACLTFNFISNKKQKEGWAAEISCVNYLPVEMINFDASCYYNRIALTWSTMSETNNDYFIVKKSYDCIEWSNIAKISGKGNTSSITNYRYLDVENSAYYKLCQVDYDNTTKCYNIIYLDCKKEKKVEIYPNPFEGYFIVNFKNWYLGKTYIKMFDLSGRKVDAWVIDVDNIDCNYKIDNSGLNLGIYILKVSSKDIDKFFKIQKK